MTRAPNFIDMQGQKVGRLTVLILDMCKYVNQSYWLCRCECGRYTSVVSQKLRNGKQKSCGCYGNDIRPSLHRSHGETAGGASREYNSWAAMIARCENKASSDYPRYGGRGIKVCQRWRHGDGHQSGFEFFLRDMGRRPSASHSIDRFPDHNGPYSPGNCRWATPTQQARNTRQTLMVRFHGQDMSLRELAEKAQLNFVTLKSRLDRGWDIERAVTMPVGTNFTGRAK